MLTGPGIQNRCYFTTSRTTALLNQDHLSESLSCARLPMSANDRAFINSSCSFSDSYVISLLPLASGSADTLLDPFSFPSFSFFSNHSASSVELAGRCFVVFPVADLHADNSLLAFASSFRYSTVMSSNSMPPSAVPLADSLL